jgi:hypothetical protein
MTAIAASKRFTVVSPTVGTGPLQQAGLCRHKDANATRFSSQNRDDRRDGRRREHALARPALDILT